MNSSIFIVKE